MIRFLHYFCACTNPVSTVIYKGKSTVLYLSFHTFCLLMRDACVCSRNTPKVLAFIESGQGERTEWSSISAIVPLLQPHGIDF